MPSEREGGFTRVITELLFPPALFFFAATFLLSSFMILLVFNLVCRAIASTADFLLVFGEEGSSLLTGL